MNNLHKDYKILFEGNGEHFTSKMLSKNWEMLYIAIATDRGYIEHTFTYSIPRVILEKTKCVTFYEYWGNETDWGNLKYDPQTFTISKGRWDTDNQMIIAYI